MLSPRLASFTLCALAAGALTSGCAPADSSDEGEEVAGAVSAAPDHYSVAYENDVVRLIRVTYEAGDTSSLHSHPAHCAVAINGSSWRASPQEGETSDLSMEMGDVACVEAGAHRMENTGSEAAEVVLVEFKPGATAGSDSLPSHPGAVSADSAHYSVVHENDVARFLRIRYGPGETSTMHRHPANCAIFLHDQTTRMEMPGGEAVENEASEPGHVQCGDAQAHLPTNTGEEELELILVELKGRATWNGGGE